MRLNRTKLRAAVAPILAAPARLEALERDVTATFQLCVLLLQPASFAAFSLAAWDLSADLRVTDTFVFTEGIWSHWQPWAALGGVLQLAFLQLRRRFPSSRP
jgi:hypothetical protein